MKKEMKAAVRFLTKIICTILLVLFQLQVCYGQHSYTLEDIHYNILDPALPGHFTCYRDSTGILKLEDLDSNKFYSYEQYAREGFDPNSIHWFRLPLESRSQNFNLWYLEVLDHNIDYLNVAITGKDTLRYTATGISSPFNTRNLLHKNFIFPLKINSGEKTIVWLSYKDEVKSRFRISLRPAQQFTEYALSEYYFLGIFYGILLIMGLYNLFVFVNTREPIYLWYIFYVICYSLHAFRIDGLGYQFAWPAYPVISQFLEQFSSFLLVLSFVLYSAEFLSVKRNYPIVVRYLYLSLLVFGILLTIHNLYFRVPGLDFFYLLPFALIFFSSILTLRKDKVTAFYSILAFSFLIVTFTIFILRAYHFIPTNVYTVYALNFGFLAEVVIYSYGMGQKLQIEKSKQEKADKMLIEQLQENEKLKDALNKDLEDKVKERTFELELKNQEMSGLLDELEIKNLQIGELNKMLESDNKELNKNIVEINKARFMLKDLSFEEFQKIYPDENACLKYLADLKWAGGYRCRKCGNENFYPGKTLLSKRCSQCTYDESATAFTFFHNSKMPVTTSFYLVYLVLANKDISSHTLGQKLGLRQKTCWAYKKRILEDLEKKGTSKATSKDWGKIFFTV